MEKKNWFNKEVEEIEKELETQRKLVKEQILAPYMNFEEIYKQYVSDKYRNADMELNIDSHIPLAAYSGTNTVIYRIAPVPSTTNVPTRTFFINFTIPDNVFRLNAS